jgi:hypothetical protein
MAQRVFGPIRGAGTQLTELEGEKPIEAGFLGTTAYAGILEKGEVNALIGPLSSKAALAKKCGSRIADSLLPDAAESFFDTAAGAGALFLVRVTDGNERESNGYLLYDHTTSIANLYARRDIKTPMGGVKAKNGGKWGGRELRYTDEFALAGDLTEITLDTGLTKFSTDEWAGGHVELQGVANARYPIVGNNAAGLVTVSADATMATDLATGGDPTNFRFYLVMDDDPDKKLELEIRDGDELPDTEFGMFVYVNGSLVGEYPDLSIDPNSGRYWVDVINDDGNNDEIEVEDLFTGQRTADVRPANHYGTSGTLTALTLVANISEFLINDISTSGGDPTFLLGTTDDDMLEQVITITMTTPTSGTAVSDRFGALGTVTLGSLFDPPNAAGGAEHVKWCPPFTVTAGGTPLAATDELIITYKPFRPDELVDGFLFPDKVNEKRLRFRITGNDHDSITVAAGSDLTDGGAISAGEEFLVEAPRRLLAGRDGSADLVDADYSQQAWDVDNSPFNQTFGKGLGLIKYATPGNTATAVQKAGLAYAAAKNHQYRYEIPATTVDEAGADEFVNETLGRSDYAKVSFPSFVKVSDPDGEQGKLKLVSATGMAHGREARIANDFGGYHKAAAGIEAKLPAVLELPTGDTVLNEELLNPRGINVIVKKQGNFVLWGDRTLWTDPTWKFAHQREMMSYYEHVLQESFDFIIFGLNNEAGRTTVHTSLISFFLPEYNKGALDTDFSFADAASIKIDTENNTPATKAAGDMIVEVLLRLVDTVERLRIFIGKQGIFESVA